jgi:hypothetical protein
MGCRSHFGRLEYGCQLDTKWSPKWPGPATRRDSLNTTSIKKPVIFGKRILSTLATAVLLMSVSCGQSEPSSGSIEVLTKQVQQLREENQRLRSLVAETGTSRGVQTAMAPSSASILQRNVDQQGLTHWLTLSSNKRHNSGCRYYRNSRGRPCGADEGIPCKICGG